MSTNRPQSASPSWLAVALRLLAAVEASFAILQALKLVAPDGQSLNGIATAHLIAAPILAVAATIFAARDRLPEAIMALAAIGLTTWASEFTAAQYTGIALILANVVRPILAVLAIVLALRGTWLGAAAFFVASIWLVWVWVAFLSDVVIFVIGAMIYGV